MILPAFDDSTFDLTDDLIAALQQKYPAIDVRAQLLELNLWLHKHRARRPKRMLRFVETWLKRVPAREIKLKLVAGPMSQYEVEQLGRKLNLPARPGEDYQAYARRLQGAK